MKKIVKLLFILIICAGVLLVVQTGCKTFSQCHDQLISVSHKILNQFQSDTVQKPAITIGPIQFSIDIADTPQEREQGLSGRKELKPSEGMLFVFPTKERFGFWMKDMQFPLDFVWIDDIWVIEITHNVAILDKDGQINTIQPSYPVDKVLEINAGAASKSGIKVGDLVQYRE